MLTKYTDAELRAEINKEITALLASREAVHPAWLTHQICKRHRDGLVPEVEGVPESEHRAFWRFSGYTLTRKLATACINDLDDSKSAEADDAPWLPGFDHLRPQYVVRRDGVDVMVPTEQLTIEELFAKATQFERNSTALAEHARELRRYAALRREQDASKASGA